jgi:uncharacterized membrane protein (UPF0127 family)
MQQVVIHNTSRAQRQPLTARYCDSFLCRLRGLTFRRAIPDNWGLLLVQERESRLDAAIHMLGMLVDLAIVWINASGEVVDVCLARRWRPAYVPRRPARYVLEANADRLRDFQIGDQVRFEKVS